MKRDQWKSQMGFVLAAVGSAIGLGNIWRFSYMAYDYGGGAFLIPYLTALMTAGIPLLILEFAVGHERIGSAPLAYAKIRRRWEWLGWWAVTFVMFGIVLYYMVIIAWCLNFFFLSFSLGWGSDPNAFFFQEFLAVSSSPGEIGRIRMPILGALVFLWVVNWAIVHRGVRGGIEKMNKVFMPLLFLLTVALVVWSVSLDGSELGLRAYVTPDFSKLGNPRVWIDAYSQIFFTLSLGFGIMIAYASYLPEKSDITRNALLTALINSGYSLFAGVAVFSVLGFMASSQAKPLSDVVSQSIGLAFIAYPKAISMMPGGSVFGAFFFLCLVVAGLSSSISIIEAFISAAVDKFGFLRSRLVTTVSVLGLVGSVIFTTQAGLLWLDIADHFITHYGLIVVGFAECILVGWIFDIRELRRHLNGTSSFRLGRWWDILIKYFVPLALTVILAGDLIAETAEPYGGYSWISLAAIGWSWLIVTMLTAFFLASRPWRTAHSKLDGRKNSTK
ncbi:MAG TPA: sodium-dependent transporter [Thermodesulfobacteriaceae bacterium]|nr:sodium-dependent transporter [Thermodesulfobacteriaceae bacterium]